MRVISGQCRGVKLDSIEQKTLRPMLDRVKEALFNILQGSLEGAVVLDLFSGSGALGIEALSRGAAHCIFVEQDTAPARLIEQNLAKCGINEGRWLIIRNSVHSLPDIKPPARDAAAELVFVDPPYAMISDPRSRAELFERLEHLVGSWILPGALMMLHHAPAPYMLWPTELFLCYDRRVYGRSQLSFFRTETE